MKSSAVFCAVLVLIFSSISVDSRSLDSHLGRLQLSILLQDSVGNVLSEFGHPAIAKRQTVYDITTQDVVDCISRTTEYQCGSSGYSQQVVDIAMGCKNNSYARNTANTCARNANGDTCGAVTLKFLSDQTNAEACSRAMQLGSCHPACRAFLQSAKDILGCCLKVYVNQTDYPLYEQYKEYVDYRLWDLCEIEIPEEECKVGGLTLKSTGEEKFCEAQELVSRFVRYECSPNVGQSLINALMKNDRCYVFTSVLVDSCSSNTKGQYCAEAIGTDLMSSINTDPLIISLNTHCYPGSGCTQSCKSAITKIKDAYGCCVNVYNDTAIGLELPSLSHDLWKECGIESPGFCETSHVIPPFKTTDNSDGDETTSGDIPTESTEDDDENSEMSVNTERTPSVPTPSSEDITTTDGVDITEEEIRTEGTTEFEDIETIEPTDFEDVETTEPTDIEDIESTEPTDFEDMVTTEPEFEDVETTEPADFEDTETTEPTNFEDIESTEPTDFEDMVTTEPEFEDVETTEPADFEDIETTEPTDFEDIETTEPTDIETAEPTDFEDMATTEPEFEDIETTEPTDIEDIETTEPEFEEIETTEPTDFEDIETTEPPTDIVTTEPTDFEDIEPTEPTDFEDIETTEPGFEDMEMTGESDDNEMTDQSEGSASGSGEGTPTFEDDEITETEDSIDLVTTDEISTIPSTSTENTNNNPSTNSNGNIMQTTESIPISDSEPDVSTEDEDTESSQSADNDLIQTTEPTNSEDIDESSEVEDEQTTDADTNTRASLPSTESVSTTQESVSPSDSTDNSVQDTERAESRLNVNPPELQALSDSALSTRALFFMTVASVVIVTLFLQQL